MNVARKLGFSHLFKYTVSPHKITYKPTGQVILFGGMNDVENITGTSVAVGYWTDIYFEEASQLKSYEEFRVVDGSIRIPNYESDLKVQITFLFNAWDVGHWLYDVFFKDRFEDDEAKLESDRFMFYRDDDFNIGYGDGLALHISSYKCNPYLSEGQLKGAIQMKEKAYDIYRVEHLGCWGNIGDKTYSHWNDSLILPSYVIMDMIQKRMFDAITIGIDFGMSDGQGKIKYSEDNAPRLGSANTMELLGVVNNWDRMVPIDEYFDSNEGRGPDTKKSSPTIAREEVDCIKKWIQAYELWDKQITCYVDNADSGGFRDQLSMEAARQDLYDLKFIACTKIPIISRVYFENYLMSLGLITPSSNCKNLIREIKNARKAKDGKVREDFDDHAINAFEYAWAPLRQRLKRWKLFKEQMV